MYITTYVSPTEKRTVDLDRTSVNLRNLFTSIHRLGDCTLTGRILEDVTTFTSVGEFGPETLVDDLIAKYGEGDVYDICRVNEQARRITVMKVDEECRSRNHMPKDVYSGSEVVYVIKPDGQRLSSELDTLTKRAFEIR